MSLKFIHFVISKKLAKDVNFNIVSFLFSSWAQWNYLQRENKNINEKTSEFFHHWLLLEKYVYWRRGQGKLVSYRLTYSSVPLLPTFCVDKIIHFFQVHSLRSRILVKINEEWISVTDISYKINPLQQTPLGF